MIENWNFHDKAAAVLLVYDGLPACVYCLEEAEQYKPREDYSRKSGIEKRDIIIDYKTTFADLRKIISLELQTETAEPN